MIGKGRIKIGVNTFGLKSATCSKVCFDKVNSKLELVKKCSVSNIYNLKKSNIPFSAAKPTSCHGDCSKRS